MAEPAANGVDRALLARTLRPENSPGYLLWQVANRWQRAQRAALAGLSITHVQFVLLAGLAWLELREGRVHQARLARFCRTDAMMTSQVVRTLERAGLIARAVDPADNRARHLTLTAAGAACLNAAMPAAMEADAAFFGGPDGEREALVEALRRLARAPTDPAGDTVTLAAESAGGATPAIAPDPAADALAVAAHAVADTEPEPERPADPQG